MNTSGLVNVNVVNTEYPQAQYKTVVLKPNMVEGANTLTQAMVNQPNTKYVIKYNYDLGGQRITIPVGCVFDFEGGSLSNGSLVGNETGLIWDGKSVIFKDELYIIGYESPTDPSDRWGRWRVPYISTRMFGDYIKTKGLKYTLCTLNNGDIYTVMEVADGNYTMDILNERDAFRIMSNTKCIVNGNLIAVPTNRVTYEIVLMRGVKNIELCGSGSIVGDIESHLTNTGEDGSGISIENGSENIYVHDLNISKCWGDGIYVGGNSVTKNIKIEKCIIHQCGRQGISVTYCDKIVIDGCYITNIERTSPRFGIDIEPHENFYVFNAVIKHNVIDNRRGVMITSASSSYAHPIINAEVYGNTLNGYVYFDTTNPWPYTILVSGNTENVSVRDNKVKGNCLFLGEYTTISNNIFDSDAVYLLGDNIRFNDNKCRIIASADAFLYVNGQGQTVYAKQRATNSHICNNKATYLYYYEDTTVSVDSLIEGNVFIPQSALDTINWIAMNGCFKNNVIKQTHLSQNATDNKGIRFEHGNCIITDNIFEGVGDWVIRMNIADTGKITVADNVWPTGGIATKHDESSAVIVLGENQDILEPHPVAS